jgi:hypothetical protein
MQSDKSSEITPVEGYKFIEISTVDASGIQSQWQAGFTGIYPLKYNDLPATHPSDKEFFEKHWRGDNYTTYEQFINKEK